MKDSKTNKGTDIPCENCGNMFYTMGDFSTRCDNCAASVADVDKGTVYKRRWKNSIFNPRRNSYKQTVSKQSQSGTSLFASEREGDVRQS